MFETTNDQLVLNCVIPRDQFEQLMRRCMARFETVEAFVEKLVELEDVVHRQYDHTQLRYHSGLFWLRFWNKSVSWRDIDFIEGTLRQLAHRLREYRDMIADRSIYEINCMGQMAGSKAGPPGIHVTRAAAAVIQKWDHTSEVMDGIEQLDKDFRLQNSKLLSLRESMGDPLLTNKE